MCAANSGLQALCIFHLFRLSNLGEHRTKVVFDQRLMGGLGLAQSGTCPVWRQGIFWWRGVGLEFPIRHFSHEYLAAQTPRRTPLPRIRRRVVATRHGSTDQLWHFRQHLHSWGGIQAWQQLPRTYRRDADSLCRRPVRRPSWRRRVGALRPHF